MNSFQIQLRRETTVAETSTVLVDAETEAEAIQKALDASHASSVEWASKFGDRVSHGPAKVVSCELVVDYDDVM